MRFVIDENMPFARDVFSTIGDAVALPGRKISNADLKTATALLVRSITRVDESLLKGTAVQFVGTATIGEDHIDKEYLRQAGIGFASAQGCNANSVSEWWTAAVLCAAEDIGFDISGLTVGIIGVGNVGHRVWSKARALGMRVLLNDPPRADSEGRHSGDPLPGSETAEFVSLKTVLAESDIITVHVPLTEDGPYPTQRLLGASEFKAMKPSVIYINASRGDTHDEAALQAALDSKLIRAAILDVWENEPGISNETVRRTLYGTPHIAGYSLDGKINGTAMVFDACMRHFGIKAAWDRSNVPPPPFPNIDVQCKTYDPLAVLRRVVLRLYPFREDVERFRGVLSQPDTSAAGKLFDHLRKTYPERREWHHTTLSLSGADKKLESIFRGLGFKIAGR